MLAQLPPQLRNRLDLDVDQSTVPQLPVSLLDLDAGRRCSGRLRRHPRPFAAQHAGGVWEFTGPAVSSSTFRAGVLAAVLADPTLSQVPGLAGLIDQLDLLLTAANTEIR